MNPFQVQNQGDKLAMKEKDMFVYGGIYLVSTTLNVFFNLALEKMIVATLCVALLIHFFFKGLNNSNK